MAISWPRPINFLVGQANHTPEHNLINEHLNELRSEVLRGAGFPTMAAPVGTRYIDTAATAGAVEWIKASGTGTAGWQVAYGDTGWRNVTVTPTTNHPGLGSFLIKRSTDSVSLAFNETDASLSGTGITTLFAAPTGFRGRASVPGSASLINSQSGAPLNTESLYVSAGTSVVVYRTGSIRRMGHLTYFANDSWPATLPGDPA